MTGQIRPEVVVVLGDRIRARRRDAGWSVVKLAEVSGVSRRMLTQIELGQANPSLATVDRIASALGTTFAALVGVPSEPSPDGVEVWSTPNGSWAYLLKAVESADVSVELWKWRLVGDDSYRVGQAPAADDSMAHVLHGRLRVRSSVSDLLVGEGESARIDGGHESTFVAETEETRFLWVVTIPRRP